MKIFLNINLKLKWKAYKPYLAQVLSSANKESRLAACNHWLTFTEDWLVIWSNEKWFILQQPQNKQTTDTGALKTLL